MSLRSFIVVSIAMLGLPQSMAQTGKSPQNMGGTHPTKQSAHTDTVSSDAGPAAEAAQSTDPGNDGALGSSLPESANLGLAGSMNAEQISEVQKALEKKGFDTGGVDGIWGENTRDALIAFQRSQSLRATGMLNRRTLIVLELDGDVVGWMNRRADEAGMRQKANNQGLSGFDSQPAHGIRNR